jgi:hypothetical protein
LLLSSGLHGRVRKFNAATENTFPARWRHRSLSVLEGAEYSGTPIPDATANNMIQQAQSLLSSLETYAGSF